MAYQGIIIIIILRVIINISIIAFKKINFNAVFRKLKAKLREVVKSKEDIKFLNYNNSNTTFY